MKYFIYCRKSQEAEDRQVMSLESQADEIKKIITANPTIEIIETYEEAYSAKNPGRPLFDEMIKRIERGHAQGIIAWHPDRLARNSMDGGKLIHLLDQGKLTDFKFCTHSFENTPHGKFMLGFMFSNSKYYSDNLSVNVKRGNATKIKNGWRPNGAPIGYKNCKETSTIIPDPEHFKIVRAMYDMVLTGNQSVGEIHRVITDEWGYKTPKRKSQGNRTLSRSGAYRILTNPFYAGYIFWNKEFHEGKHKPVITKQEYEQAQNIIHGRTKKKLKTHTFPYSGVFTCGACGLGVTAERKTKKSGKQYVYYHCTRVHRSPRCTQPTITGVDLDKQISKFLDLITIPKEIYEWFHTALIDNKELLIAHQNKQNENHCAEVESLGKQITNLTDLRVREMISDDEFTNKRETLKKKLVIAKENASKSKSQKITLEPLEIIANFNKEAKNWYFKANDDAKQKLLKILCWNPQLKDNVALLQAKYPLFEIANLNDCLRLRTGVENVGTKTAIDEAKAEKQFKKILNCASHPDTNALAEEIEELAHTLKPNHSSVLMSVLPSKSYKS